MKRTVFSPFLAIIPLLSTGCSSHPDFKAPEVSQASDHASFLYIRNGTLDELCIPDINTTCNQKKNRLILTLDGGVAHYRDGEASISCATGDPDGFFKLLGMNPSRSIVFDDQACASDLYQTDVVKTIASHTMFFVFTLGTYAFTGGLTYQNKVKAPEVFERYAKRWGTLSYPPGRYHIADIEEFTLPVSAEGESGILLTYNAEPVAMITPERTSDLAALLYKGLEEKRHLEQNVLYNSSVRNAPVAPKYSAPPIETVLTKSQYETKEMFAERVRAYAKQRRHSLEKAAEKYSHAIEQYKKEHRQHKEAYEEKRHEIDGRYDALYEVIESEQGRMIAKMTEFFSGRYLVSDYRYDAENERLHFLIGKTQNQLHQRAYIDVSPAEAMEVSDGFAYAKYSCNDKKTVKLKQILLHGHPIRYTNVHYVPVSAVAVLESAPLRVPKQPYTYTLPAAKFEPLPAPSSKQTYIIDVVDRTNGRVPDWFLTPAPGVYFGAGDSLELARSVALASLAEGVSARVNSSYTVRRKSNGTASTIETDQHIDVTASQQITSGYNVIHQERIDGIWYIALQSAKEST